MDFDYFEPCSGNMNKQDFISGASCSVLRTFVWAYQGNDVNGKKSYQYWQWIGCERNKGWYQVWVQIVCDNDRRSKHLHTDLHCIQITPTQPVPELQWKALIGKRWQLYFVGTKQATGQRHWQLFGCKWLNWLWAADVEKVVKGSFGIWFDRKPLVFLTSWALFVWITTCQ